MQPMDFQPMIESRPIRDIAYEVLKHAIVSGEIPAGERIIETEYADRLHISRTPLREALRKLELDGLVESQVRKGVIVRAFTVDDIEQIYTIHNALELITLPAVIENATAEDLASLHTKLNEMDRAMASDDLATLSPLARAFHASITAISRKKRIIRAIASQDEYITRFSAMSIRQESRRDAAHQEHHELVRLIEQRDLAAFSDLMTRHIERSKENCLAALHQQGLAK